MPIEPLQFRLVMRRFATGVTVITVRDGDSIHAMTANAFASVSLTPPLALVCVQKGTTTHAWVSRAGIFAVSILSAAQRGLAERFAHQVPMPPDPFGDIRVRRSVTGAPILDDAIAYLDCKVVAAHDAGDHTVFVGEVVEAGFGRAVDAEPLLWLDGHYTSIVNAPIDQ